LDQAPDVRKKTFNAPVDTLVIDTLDEVQRLLIRGRLREIKRDTFRLEDWGWLSEVMQTIVRGFRNLDMHVVLLCHLKETTDEENNRLYFKPGLQGAIADQIPGYVDLALHLRTNYVTVVENGEAVRKVARHLYSFPDPQYPWIKDRSGKLAAEVLVDFHGDFDRIHGAIFDGTQPVPSRSATKPQDPVVEKKTAQDKAPLPEEADTEAHKIVPKRQVANPVAVTDTSPTDLKCEECGGDVEDKTDADMSRIRFRRVLCKPCFRNAKTTKSG
jgi:hypothetical protein